MAANFVQRSRHGSVYYFRRRIPDDLHALGLPRQIFRTLHTCNRHEAGVRAREMAVESDSLFSRIRAIAMNETYRDKFTYKIELDEFGRAKSISADAQEHETEALNTAVGAALAALKPVDSEARMSALATINHSGKLNGPTIATAVARYWTDNKLSARSARSYSAKLARVEQYFGANTRLKDLTQEHVANFANEINADGSREIATRNGYLTVAGVFFNWCKDRYNEMPALSTKSLKLKPSTLAHEARDAFSIGDLRVLMQGVQQFRANAPHKFWVTALAIYTGARLEEIAQLDVFDNIAKDPHSDFWYIDINRRDGRSVKTNAGCRKVPLHPALVDAGFIEYVEGLKAAGKSRQLFPAWKPRVDRKYGGKNFSHKITRWGGSQLTKLLDEGKLEGEKFGYFHSARHALINNLKQRIVEESIRCAITGHEHGGINSNTYAKPYYIKTTGEMLVEKLPEYSGLILHTS